MGKDDKDIGSDVREEASSKSVTTPGLLPNISQSLILLNLFLPENNKLVWVTTEEMRDRLIHCGVHKLLSVDILAKAINNANRGSNFLTRTSMGRINFYRPAELAGKPGTLKDQHASENGPPHRRFCIFPSCTGYFPMNLKTNVGVMLKNVNDALMRLSNSLEERESLRQRAQREATRQCDDDSRKESTVRWLSMSLLLFPSLSSLSNDYDNGDTTDDIPLAGDEYDMDNLGSSPDDEDDERAMISTINNVDVTPPPACDGHDGSSPDLEDEERRLFEDDMCGFCSNTDWEDEECRPVDFSHVEGNKGFGLFDIAMLNDFIYRATLHSSMCGAPQNLKMVHKRWGAGIKIEWTCAHYQSVFQLHNCIWTKCAVVSPTKKQSRMTPEINTRIANGARMNGINMSQIWGLFETALDTKIMHPERKFEPQLKKHKPIMYDWSSSILLNKD